MFTVDVNNNFQYLSTTKFQRQRCNKHSRNSRVCTNCTQNRFLFRVFSIRLANWTCFRQSQFLVLPKPWVFSLSLALFNWIISSYPRISVPKWNLLISIWMHTNNEAFTPLFLTLFQFKLSLCFWRLCKSCRKLEFYPWVIEFFPWVFSFFLLEFFSKCPICKPALSMSKKDCVTFWLD